MREGLKAALNGVKSEIGALMGSVEMALVTGDEAHYQAALERARGIAAHLDLGQYALTPEEALRHEAALAYADDENFADYDDSNDALLHEEPLEGVFDDD